MCRCSPGRRHAWAGRASLRSFSSFLRPLPRTVASARRRSRTGASWRRSCRSRTCCSRFARAWPPSGSSPGRAELSSRAGSTSGASAAPASARLIPELGRLGLLRYAEPNRIRSLAGYADLGDPLVDRAWHLDRIGAETVEPPAAGVVPITIVDTGLDVAHPDFAERPGVTLLERSGAQHVRAPDLPRNHGCLDGGRGSERRGNGGRLPDVHPAHLRPAGPRRRDHHRRPRPGRFRGRREPEPRRPRFLARPVRGRHARRGPWRAGRGRGRQQLPPR